MNYSACQVTLEQLVLFNFIECKSFVQVIQQQLQQQQQQPGKPILIGGKPVTLGGKPLQFGGKPVQLIGKGGSISLVPQQGGVMSAVTLPSQVSCCCFLSCLSVLSNRVSAFSSFPIQIGLTVHLPFVNGTSAIWN